MAPSFKDICTEADMRRFALCFLHTKDLAQIDWAAAAADYDPKVKPESFKTVTTKAINRVKKAAAGEGGEVNGDAEAGTKTKGKGKGAAGKRKAAEDGENDVDGEKPKKKPVKRGKKAAAQAEDGEANIKTEAAGNSDEELA